MSPYVLIEAYACDLAYEVNHWLKQGYVPMGGPTPGREGIGSRKLVQAMYNASIPVEQEAELVLPTSQELEDAVHEANAEHPGSASMGEPFAFATDSERRQWDTDNLEIYSYLGRRSEFLVLDEGKCMALVNKAEKLFHRRITHLRLKQQEPYMKYFDPKTNADRFERIVELSRVGLGVMEEYFAGCRARNPKAPRVVMVDEDDAKKIASILESTRAQYPTEHQAAVSRFKRRVHGVQDED
jgi:hypothetical protein